MKKDFTSLADAGAKLATLLQEQGIGAREERIVLAPIMPNGLPVALAVAEHVKLPVFPIRVERTDAGVVVLNGSEMKSELAGALIVVIDDGVETGTAAMAAGSALADINTAGVVLAVPVCPRSARVMLDTVYSQIYATVQPMAPRALRWHFENFDTISERDAEIRLATWRETH